MKVRGDLSFVKREQAAGRVTGDLSRCALRYRWKLRMGNGSP